MNWLWQKIKNDPGLSVALSLPVLLVLITMALVYIPRYVIKPQYNFIYWTNPYGSNIVYAIENNKLTRQQLSQTAPVSGYQLNSNPNFDQSKLFLYEAWKNQIRPISFEEASNFYVNSDLTSKDGFGFTSPGYGGDSLVGFFFGAGERYNGHNLVLKHQKSSFTVPVPEYSYDVRFLGWVEN